MYEHWFLISSPYWFMRQQICADLNNFKYTNNKSHNTRSGVPLFCRSKIPRCTAHGKGRPYWRSPVFSHWPSPEERWGRAKKHAISEKDVEFECLDFLKVMMNILLSKRQNCLFTHRNGRRNLLELLHRVGDLSKSYWGVTSSFTRVFWSRKGTPKAPAQSGLEHMRETALVYRRLN